MWKSILLGVTLAVCLARRADAQPLLAATDLAPTLTELRDKLVEVQPLAGSPAGRRAVDSTLAELLALLARAPLPDSILLADVIALAQPLQTVLSDGHLQLSPKLSKAQRAAIRARYYPIGTYLLDDGRYVLGDTLSIGARDFLPGSELLRVGGSSLPKLVAHLAAFGGMNDEGYAEGARALAATTLSYGFQASYGPRDSLGVTVRAVGDTAAVSGVVYPDTLLRRRGRKPSRRERLDRLLSLTPARGDSAWVLQVRTFSSRPYRGLRYRRRLRDIFRQLRRDSARALVIDLRGNGGGALDKMERLYSYLTDEPYVTIAEMRTYNPRAAGRDPFTRLGYRAFGGVRREGDHLVMRNVSKPVEPSPAGEHFGGAVVVLISVNTFSAASMFAHYVQISGRGHLAGSTSGGSRRVVYGGNIRSYDIGPHDELSLRVPNWEIRLANPGEGTVTPDLPIPVTPAVLASPRDERLEIARAHAQALARQLE